MAPHPPPPPHAFVGTLIYCKIARETRCRSFWNGRNGIDATSCSYHRVCSLPGGALFRALITSTEAEYRDRHMQQQRTNSASDWSYSSGINSCCCCVGYRRTAVELFLGRKRFGHLRTEFGFRGTLLENAEFFLGGSGSHIRMPWRFLLGVPGITHRPRTHRRYYSSSMMVAVKTQCWHTGVIIWGGGIVNLRSILDGATAGWLVDLCWCCAVPDSKVSSWWYFFWPDVPVNAMERIALLMGLYSRLTLRFGGFTSNAIRYLHCLYLPFRRFNFLCLILTRAYTISSYDFNAFISGAMNMCTGIATHHGEKGHPAAPMALGVLAWGRGMRGFDSARQKAARIVHSSLQLP